ncbi:MAG: VWA domain-containing protein [Thermoflexales bacterium]|nr:VWA domain-containing protein [Thermoflexales bacterium]MCS7325367.1 VWA domain-containing protein [Thermoflexales bacterium]MCX7938630.1 VWA domain-containing protein [Thermoflexales bacterium]MDW8054506.1 VWA domain-containing protein [Anaerolineae bacterium]MDW8292875.1 VWA domain-containing protein [Anaerolineae bacterium]
MEFLMPSALMLMLLAPLALALYAWMRRRRKPIAVSFPSFALLGEAARHQSRWRTWIPALLFSAALLSASVAAARPVAVTVAPFDRTQIVLALDVSLSMCATDIHPNRLAAMQQAALRFVERQRPEVKIGVVAFAGFAELVQPPTTDHSAVRRTIERLTVGRRTAIGSAILRAIDAIAENDETIPPVSRSLEQSTPQAPKGTYAPSIIVLLTDGVSNTGPRPEVAAGFAAERGIRVYTIGFGTARTLDELFCTAEQTGGRPLYVNRNQWGPGGIAGGPNQFRRGIDEDALRYVAEQTGGQYFAAESLEELLKVFDSLPSNLAARTQQTEIGAIFAALSALLAVAGVVLSLRWQPML